MNDKNKIIHITGQLFYNEYHKYWVQSPSYGYNECAIHILREIDPSFIGYRTYADHLGFKFLNSLDKEKSYHKPAIIKIEKEDTPDLKLASLKKADVIVLDKFFSLPSYEEVALFKTENGEYYYMFQKEFIENLKEGQTLRQFLGESPIHKRDIPKFKEIGNSICVYKGPLFIGIKKLIEMYLYIIENDKFVILESEFKKGVLKLKKSENLNLNIFIDLHNMISSDMPENRNLGLNLLSSYFNESNKFICKWLLSSSVKNSKKDSFPKSKEFLFMCRILCNAPTPLKLSFNLDDITEEEFKRYNEIFKYIIKTEMSNRLSSSYLFSKFKVNFEVNSVNL